MVSGTRLRDVKGSRRERERLDTFGLLVRLSQYAGETAEDRTHGCLAPTIPLYDPDKDSTQTSLGSDRSCLIPAKEGEQVPSYSKC